MQWFIVHVSAGDILHGAKKDARLPLGRHFHSRTLCWYYLGSVGDACYIHFFYYLLLHTFDMQCMTLTVNVLPCL